MTSSHPTSRELDVLSLLWKHGSGTVAEIRAKLADDLSYTAVLSVLQTLEQKQYITHTKEGRAYRYHPVRQPAETQRGALRRMVDKIFHGSAEVLLARLVDDQSLTSDELRRMRAYLDSRLKERSQ